MMKKIIILLVLVFVCTGLFVGCGELSTENLKVGIPHNPSIQLDEKQENVIKQDNLMLDEKLNAVTDTVWYIGKNEVVINDIAFSQPSYTFEKGIISSIYYGSIPDTNINVDDVMAKLKKYFNTIYGESKSKNKEKPSWQINLDSGEKYSISLDKPKDLVLEGTVRIIVANETNSYY